MFNDTVMEGHGHCLNTGHWPLDDFALAHWTLAIDCLCIALAHSTRNRWWTFTRVQCQLTYSFTQGPFELCLAMAECDNCNCGERWAVTTWA